MFRNYLINWACNGFSDHVIQVLDAPCKADEALEHIMFEGCPWEIINNCDDEILNRDFRTCYSYDGQNGMGADVRFVGVYLYD